MARIRTIKPEFPQSESMGRVSRDARLLYIMLWTIADDEGRARAAPRMIASLLFPYDDDAKAHVAEWLFELERENCVTLYEVDGNAYVQIEKWLSHQKIDRPSKSRFPACPKNYRENVTKPREPSSPDLVPRTKEGTKEGTIARSADADEIPAALQAYNAVAEETGWPVAQALTPKRRSALKARMADAGGLSGWRETMAKARASPFLRGESGRDRAHEKWTPDLDFFLQQSSFVKLMEGKYDDRQAAATDRNSDILRGIGNAIAGYSQPG